MQEAQGTIDVVRGEYATSKVRLVENCLSSVYFDMSLKGSIKQNIDELIYKAIETIIETII